MDGLVCSARTEQPACVRTLPACLPTISAPASQGSPGGGGSRKAGNVTPNSQICGAWGVTVQPAAFPRWRDQNPREEGVLLWGQETQAQRPAGVLRATDTEVSPCHVLAHNPSGLPWPLQARRAHSGVWQEERSGQIKLPAPASRQTATPPASCRLHGFTFLPVIHICGDAQGVQSEEGGEPPGGHDKGERFLEEHNLFSSRLRNWRSESQRLMKISPRGLAAGPQRAHRWHLEALQPSRGERVWRWSKQTLPESGVTSGEFSILSEEYSPWSGIWGDIYPIG